MLRTVALVAAALSASLAVGCASNAADSSAGEPLNNTGYDNGAYTARTSLSGQDAEGDAAPSGESDASTDASGEETTEERLERMGEITPPAELSNEQELARHYLKKAEERKAALDYEGALKFIDFADELDRNNPSAARLREEIYAITSSSRAYDAHRPSSASVRVSEARHTVMLKTKDAERYVAAGRYTEAIEAADAGLDVIRWAGMMQEEDDLLVRLSEIKKQAVEGQAIERNRSASSVREQQRRWEELDALAALESFRDEVRERYTQAQEHFDRKEYTACIQVLDQILQKDPRNSDVLELKKIAADLERGRRTSAAQSEFSYRWNMAITELQQAFAYPEKEIEFPDPEYWADVERRREIVLRGQVTGQSSEDIAVRALLDSRRINLEVTEGKNLGDVLASIRKAVPELNFVLIDAEKDGPDTEMEIQEIFISNITVRRALSIVNRQAEDEDGAFKWYVADGAVIIDGADSEGGEGVTRVFHVADLLISLRPFPGVEPRLAEDNTQAASGSRWGDDGDVQEPEPLEGDDLVDLLTAMFPDAWGGNFEDPQFRQNMLVVNNEIEIVEKVEQLLNDLRRTQGLVVNIETRFITIRDDFLEDIGIDFRGVGGSPSGTNPQPVPAALDDVNFGTTSVPDGVGTDNEAGFFFQDIQPNRSVNQDIRARSELLFDTAVGGRRAGFGLTNTGGASFQLAFVDNPEINAILRAVQKKERATLLTAPRLAVHNTQRGNVSLMNELSYISDFDVSVSAGATIADPVIEVIRDGIVLDVKPIVSADRRYVTIELRPTLATLLRPIATVTTSLGVGPPVAIQTPELRLQRLRTTVTVPDGGSFLIGGLRRLEEADLESGVPILSDIPLVGWLFTRKAKSTVREDIIIIVSATIVDLEERTREYTGSD